MASRTAMAAMAALADPNRCGKSENEHRQCRDLNNNSSNHNYSLLNNNAMAAPTSMMTTIRLATATEVLKEAEAATASRHNSPPNRACTHEGR